MPDTHVTMIRPHLRDLPQVPVPEGLALRWFQPGDEALWLAVQHQAERIHQVTAATFAESFGDDVAELARRQAFLMTAAGNPVGTATAWFNPSYHGVPFGRIHWVAVVPDWQGQGLGAALLTATCNRLAELGHDRAYLATSSSRLPAIRLYRRFGFEPEIVSAEDRRVWAEIDHGPAMPKPARGR